MKRSTLLFLFSALTLLAAFGALPTAGSAQEKPIMPISPQVVPDDTVRHAIPPGRVLILALPDSVGGDAVASYHMVRTPARSWLVDASFFWRTDEADTGTHEFLLEATHTGPPRNKVPLVLVVEVR